MARRRFLVDIRKVARTAIYFSQRRQCADAHKYLKYNIDASPSYCNQNMDDIYTFEKNVPASYTQQSKVYNNILFSRVEFSFFHNRII